MVKARAGDSARKGAVATKVSAMVGKAKLPESPAEAAHADEALPRSVNKNSIPDGIPTSGRTWKVKQTRRSSTLHRSGVMSHMNKSFEEKKAAKEKMERIKAFEKDIKEEKLKKIEAEKARKAEKEKRRVENEYKTSVYQVINPSKLKTMSKKQLRLVKKTAVNAAGQVELVNPWESKTANGKGGKGSRKK